MTRPSILIRAYITIGLFCVALGILSGCGTEHHTSAKASADPTYGQELQTIRHSLTGRYKTLAASLKIEEVHTRDRNQWILFTLGLSPRYEGLAYVRNIGPQWRVEDTKIVNATSATPFTHFTLWGHVGGHVPQTYVAVGGRVSNTQITSVEIDFKNSADLVVIDHQAPYYLVTKMGLNHNGGLQRVVGLNQTNKVVVP